MVTSTISGEYLGMQLEIPALDAENRAYFGYCAAGELRLQACQACGRLRYPPGTACPWCAHPHSVWAVVAGRGTVYSYTEVHHAIQSAFRSHVPYLTLLVELDVQRGQPSEHEAIRMIGNLVTPDSALAPPEMVAEVGIGTRVRTVFRAVAPGLAIPQWTIDRSVAATSPPYRFRTG